MPEELWTEVRDIIQEAMIKTIHKKKKCKKAKWLSDEALQIAKKRRETKVSFQSLQTSGHIQQPVGLYLIFAVFQCFKLVGNIS